MSNKNTNSSESSSREDYDDLLRAISEHFERARLADYVDLMQKPRRMIILNFLSGAAKGFGLAVGFTILGAVLIYLLQKIVVLNLPVISEVIAEMVKLVQLKLR
ncbi:DUF5665 domain-containing protein [Clostridium cylindrosporum]|uniref:Uncharacterized protein n=1 Tax=Clostridium cylindrosporum DSM 605 TaxID=1121307 RepID=A0A0J8G0Y1_CLOCY|nr:DUF5665 domain-containing protein [Clostridium cylindrosporum]KMT21436.1 hypothetical protein CLCY_2c01960 [Clostridium cylindrosporum DSM 605]